MSGIMNMLVAAKTAIAAAIDSYFNLTTLLLSGDGTNGAQNNTFLDSSSNNFSITRNGNTTQGTFSPFSQTGWSNYFGAGSSTIYTASSTDFNITGDYTLECFAWANSYPSIWRIFQMNGCAIDNNGSSGTIYVTLPGVSTASTGTTLPLNQWNHIAVVRVGSTVKVFLNGSQIYTATNSNNTTGGTTANIGGLNGNSQSFDGYISNLRLVIGSAVYSVSGSTITVPTSPLTVFGSTNTKLLTCQSNNFIDNSSYAKALTVAGSPAPSVQAFSPFAPTAAYSASTNGGSGYFDGTGDFLVLADNVALEPGNGDFTWEAWAYLPNNTSDYSLYAGTSNGDLDIRRFSDGTLRIGRINTAWDSTSSVISIANQWAHLAISRSGSTLRMYLNGVQIFSGTNSNNYFVTTSAVIGNTQSAQYVSGYLSGYRLVKGTALYTAAFTPPTAPPTNITNTSLLLNFTNGGIIDATGKNVLETVGNAQISTTQSKWGGSSLYFDGSGDALLIPRPLLFDFGSGDFTIECWFNYNSGTTNYGLFTTRSGSGNYAPAQIQIESGNVLKGYASTSGSSWAANITASTSPVSGSWYHVAFVRNGTTFTLYLNGNSVGSATGVSGSLMANSYGACIGAQAADLTNPMNGYIDDLRITRYARYTANFTPPTQAFALQ